MALSRKIPGDPICVSDGNGGQCDFFLRCVGKAISGGLAWMERFQAFDPGFEGENRFGMKGGQRTVFLTAQRPIEGDAGPGQIKGEVRII